MDVLGQLNAEEEARKQFDAMKGELIMQGQLIKPSGRFGRQNLRFVSLYEPGVIQRSQNMCKEDGKMIDLRNFLIKPETMIIFNEEEKSLTLKTSKKDDKDFLKFIQPIDNPQITRKSTLFNTFSGEKPNLDIDQSQKNIEPEFKQTTDIQKWFEVITKMRNAIRDKVNKSEEKKNSKVQKHASVKDNDVSEELKKQEDFKISNFRSRISGSYKKLPKGDESKPNQAGTGKKAQEDWEMIEGDENKDQQQNAEGKKQQQNPDSQETTPPQAQTQKKPSEKSEEQINKQHQLLNKAYQKLLKTHQKLDSDFSKLSKKCQEMEDCMEGSKNLQEKIMLLESQLDENTKNQEQESIMLNDYQQALQEKQQKNAQEYQRSLTFIQGREQANIQEIHKLREENIDLAEKLERKRLYLSNYKELVQENRSLKKHINQIQNKTITDEAKKYTIGGEYNKNKANLSHQEATELISKLYKQDIIKRMEIIQWMQNDFDEQMKMNVTTNYIKPIQIELQMKIKQVFVEQINEPKKIQIVLWNDKKSYKSSHYKINPETHTADIGQKWDMNTSLDFDTEQYKFISNQPQCILILLQLAETNEIIGSLNFDLSKCAKSSSHTDNYVTTTLAFESEKYQGSNVKIKFKLQILEDLPQYNDVSGSQKNIDNLISSITYPPINILRHQESVGKVVTSAIDKLEGNVQHHLAALYNAMNRADSSFFVKNQDGQSQSTYQLDNNKLIELMKTLSNQIPDEKVPQHVKDIIKEQDLKLEAEAKLLKEQENKLNPDQIQLEEVEEGQMCRNPEFQQSVNTGERDMMADPKLENIAEIENFSMMKNRDVNSTAYHYDFGSSAATDPRPSFKVKAQDQKKDEVEAQLKQQKDEKEALMKMQPTELFNCIKFAQTPLQKIKKIKSKPFKVDDLAMQIWEAQGPLNFELLYKDVSIQLTNFLVNLIYHECTVDGREAIYIGQSDKNKQPNGFVRIIFKTGQIYEGTVLNNSKQGWGRYIESNSCKIGYWKNGQLHGNSYCFQWTNNTDEGFEEIDGWYENGKHTGEKNNFKHHREYPFFNYKKDYFLEQHKKIHAAYTIAFNMKEGFNLEQNFHFSKQEARIYEPILALDNMKEQQDEIYNKIIKYKDIILQHDKILQEIKDKQVVMAIGATGVGKSTLMNAFIQGTENMDLNDDCDIVANSKLIHNGEVVFEIGHGNKSCTETPGFYRYSDMYFLDCPGLQDSDKLKEYPNQTAVHFVQKNAKALVVLLIISPDQFVNRGAVFTTQLTGVLRQISPDCPKQRIADMLIPLIVQYKATLPQRIKKDINNVIEALNKKFKDCDPDYENIFDGPRYPQATEVDQIISLCQVVIDNYICVDPLDTSSSKFKEREQPCSQVMEIIANRFKDNKFGVPSEFNDDLPLQLSELLDTEMFEKLLDAKNFQNVKALRDEVEVIFDPILKPWKGRNTSDCIQLLNDKIFIADAAGKDAILQWYINKVSPLFKEQAQQEGKQIRDTKFGNQFKCGNTHQYPIIHWLQYLTENFSIINEEQRDAFTYEIWRDSLDWFIRPKNAGTLESLEKCNLLFQQPSSTDQMIPFSDAIKKLLETEQVNAWDDEIKNSWAKLGFDEFLHHFKLALPKTYPLRFFKSQEVLFMFDRPVVKQKQFKTMTATTSLVSGASQHIDEESQSNSMQNQSTSYDQDQHLTQGQVSKK